MGISSNWGHPFGGPHDKDYGILGCILGCPYFGKLPNMDVVYNIPCCGNLQTLNLKL